MFKLNSMLLSLTLVCFLSNFAYGAVELKGELNLDKDIKPNPYPGVVTSQVTINGNGHSIDGSGGRGITQQDQNVNYSIDVNQVGGFNLTAPTENSADTVVKFNEQGELVRYEIKDTGSAHNFDNNNQSGTFINSRTNVNITDSVIKDNTPGTTNAQYGGAIKVLNNDKAAGVETKIIGSYFTGNHLSNNNTAQGGAIWAQQKNGKLTILDSYFTKNTVNAGTATSSFIQGGAIFNSSGAVDIKNSYFGFNTVTGTSAKGGAIYGDYYSVDNGFVLNSHDLKNVVFENNSVNATSKNASAGALYLANSSNLENVHFISNSANLDAANATKNSNVMGGAFMQGSSSNAISKLKNVVFKNNSITSKNATTAYGGGVYTSSSDVTIENSIFEGNSIDNQADTSLVPSQYFTDTAGGAIYQAASSNGTVTIRNSVFESNKVDSNNYSMGGAIANKSATGYPSTKHLNIYNSTFNNNQANSTADEDMSGMELGAAGGAIYNNNYNVLNVEDSSFTNNSVSTASSSSEKLFGGGAVYNEQYAISTFVDTTFENNTAIGQAASGGAIFNNEGQVNIIAKNKDVVFSGNKAGSNINSLVSNAIYTIKGRINLNAAEGKKIIFNDAIASSDKHTYGVYPKIQINQQGEWENRESTYKSGDNKIPIDAPTQGTIVFNADMTGFVGDVNIYGGTVELGPQGKFFNAINAFNVYNPATLNLANGVIQNHYLGNFNLEANLNLALDADLQKGEIDSFSANSIQVKNDSKINIQKINVIADATAQTTGISLSEYDDLMDIITLEDGAKTALGKIYKYDVELDEEKQELSFTRTGGIDPIINPGGSSKPTIEQINPAVMTGAVATQAGYYTQLNSYDQAFSNIVSKMMAPKIVRQMSDLKNRYAIKDEEAKRLRAFHFENEEAAWFRPYTSFEKVGLKGGVDVDNIMYGSYMGTQSRVFDLKNGKKAQLGGYIGYSGSHQTFSGNSLYQNGGTLGLSGSLYKNNFFSALTANVGASVVQASNMFGNEDFPMLMSGVASKSGYNLEFKEGKFVIQPNFLISYSFINAFDYTNAAGVKISADPLHAIQIAPGVRLFANTKNGWQPYINVAMRWNIIDKTNFSAANVALPELSTKPYIEYGLGIQRTFHETLNGYFQTVIRNGGRNGIALTLGLDILLGKNREQSL